MNTVLVARRAMPCVLHVYHSRVPGQRGRSPARTFLSFWRGRVVWGRLAALMKWFPRGFERAAAPAGSPDQNAQTAQ
jgi:hypothetical protein